jgi:general secretion pathway protein E
MTAATASKAPSPAVLAQARANAQGSRHPVVEELAALLSCDAREALHALAQLFGHRIVEVADMLGMAPAFEALPLAQAQQMNAVLLRDAGGGPAPAAWWLVLADPFDGDLQAFVDHRVRAPVRRALALPSDIHAFLLKMEEGLQAMTGALDGLPGSEGAEAGRGIETLSLATLGRLDELGASPAVKVVNSTLYDALKLGASDIHLESTPQGLSSKYRIDGVLDPVAHLNGTQLAEQIVSRIKVLAELDIAERRVPQDGSFRVEAGGREIDLRVSIMPSIHGEDAVIRILDKRAVLDAAQSLTLDVLGFDAHTLRALRRLVGEPYGMVLVTGPTGSGKTTTLYGALSEVNNGREKIITIEDPVEYQLAGILQIPVNAKKGLTFARGLRSILRHDPDKIMVGEIRDQETAEIAVQSALTGHLVLSTVHANSVYDVFGRFHHMGVDLYSFASALNGVSAQRLVRLNCPHCGQPCTPSDQDLAEAGLRRAEVEGFNFIKGTGCGDCRGTGYRGRKAVAEVLTVTPEIAELIVERRPVRQLMEAARRQGAKSLFDDALALVARGETTLEEVRRVTLAAAT